MTDRPGKQTRRPPSSAPPPRPTPAPERNARRGARHWSPGRLFAWGAIGLVVAVVASLLVAKAVFPTSSPASATNTWTALPSSIAREIQDIPASVFDEVGITSPAAAVSAPVVVTGTPALTIDGKPGVFYVGGEFCPFCAAERWALTTALSRFGSFSGLGQMQSSPADEDPDTQTVTFRKASFASPFVALHAVERYSSVPDPATGYWRILEPLSATDRALLSTYDQPRYLPGVPPGGLSVPFVDIGNKVFVPSAGYSPSILQGLTRRQIAGGLTDPSNPVTRAILSTANYLSASICSVDGQQPMAVCTSRGVSAAAQALHLTR
jgi:hypothetical protein